MMDENEMLVDDEYQWISYLSILVLFFWPLLRWPEDNPGNAQPRKCACRAADSTSSPRDCCKTRCASVGVAFQGKPWGKAPSNSYHPAAIFLMEVRWKKSAHKMGPRSITWWLYELWCHLWAMPGCECQRLTHVPRHSIRSGAKSLGWPCARNIIEIHWNHCCLEWRWPRIKSITKRNYKNH